MLEALGGCQRFGIDRCPTDYGAYLARRFADGIKEGSAGVLHIGCQRSATCAACGKAFASQDWARAQVADDAGVSVIAPQGPIISQPAEGYSVVPRANGHDSANPRLAPLPVGTT